MVFMSGVVELNGQKHDIVVFKNTRKVKEKQPDYQILKSEPYKKEEKPQEFVPEEVPVINQNIDDANQTLQINGEN